MSINHNLSSNLLKSDNLQSGNKVSYNYFMSMEPSIIYNDYGKILTKDYTICGTLMIDYASDYIFWFI